MTSSVEQLLMLAHGGDTEPLGRLLERYRNYLNLLAAGQLHARLQVRTSASDIVQDTFLQVHRAFPQFRGQTVAEFVGWLRQILASQLAHALEKHVHAEKRDVRREVSFEAIAASLDRSTIRLENVLANESASPSSVAQRHEHAVLLAEVLATLPGDYRQVLVLRNLEGLSFKEVAERFGRSVGAVRMLWFRAIRQLREKLTEKGLI